MFKPVRLPAFRLRSFSALRSPPTPGTDSNRFISCATATTIAMTAIETCKAQGYNVSANVLGREGQVVVAIRNPAAGFATFENSMKKAYTARDA